MDLSTRQGRKEQGQRIQQAVERAGLSIEELAQRIGCSRALIYQYLNGSTLAQPDRLQQIGHHCGVPITYFYTDSSTDSATNSHIETATDDSITGQDALRSASSPQTTQSAPQSSSQSGQSGSEASATSPDLNSATSNSTRATTNTPPSPSSSTTGIQDIIAPHLMVARLSEGLRTLQELAHAQESPPDYRAMASTCERILSLAAQIGDRDALTRGQLDLGIALNKLGDFPRAAEALNRAVTLALETQQRSREMVARQSLGRALVMMGRSQQARVQFQRIVSDGDFQVRWRALLALGSLHEQQGEYQAAMECFDDAAAQLEEAETTRAADTKTVAEGMLYVNTNRRNVYLAGGDLLVARELADRCLSDAETLGVPDQNLEARLDRGICDLWLGQWGTAYTGLTTMLQLSRFVCDQYRENVARAVLGLFFAAAGDFDAAIAYGKDALAMALSRGDKMTELYAQLALADAYSGPEGRLLEARYHANQALAITTSVSYARSEVEGRIRLARISYRANDVEGARDAATRALRLAKSLGARHLESLAQVWAVEASLMNLLTNEIEDNVKNQFMTEAEYDVKQIIKNEARNESETEAENDERLIVARAELDEAITLAQSTGFLETVWRGLGLKGRIAQRQGDLVASEAAFRQAIALLEKLRESLIGAGVPDTLLENEECLRIYVQLIGLLRASGRDTEIAELLDSTGWPPLLAQTNSLG